MITEIWKDVIGYEGLYQVSDLGNVKSLNYRRTGKEKNIYINTDKYGYLNVMLSKNSLNKRFYVHRLASICFLKSIADKCFINHIDGNKTNNNINNLEWCNCSENIKHAYKLGLNKGNKKTKTL